VIDIPKLAPSRPFDNDRLRNSVFLALT